MRKSQLLSAHFVGLLGQADFVAAVITRRCAGLDGDPGQITVQQKKNMGY